jgi:hypothetical protein
VFAFIVSNHHGKVGDIGTPDGDFMFIFIIFA